MDIEFQNSNVDVVQTWLNFQTYINLMLWNNMIWIRTEYK